MESVRDKRGIIGVWDTVLQAAQVSLGVSSPVTVPGYAFADMLADGNSIV